MNLKRHIDKINEILSADYDHECPDAIRSNKFVVAIRKMLKEIFPDCEIVSVNGYCYASGFIKNSEGKYVYFATEDYRWPQGSSWKNNILYRTAKDERDFHGGSNHYADLEYLQECVYELFNQQEV